MLTYSNTNKYKRNEVILVITLIAVSVGVCSCYTTGHPMPCTDELYEAKDPDTHKPVLRLIATKWGDNTYKEGPFVTFSQPDGTIWKIDLFVNEPKYWEVVRVHPEKGTEKIALGIVEVVGAGKLRTN